MLNYYAMSTMSTMKLALIINFVKPKVTIIDLLVDTRPLFDRCDGLWVSKPKLLDMTFKLWSLVN